MTVRRAALHRIIHGPGVRRSVGIGIVKQSTANVVQVAADAVAFNMRRNVDRIRATLDIAWLTGWAPHRSQQQPLKPGSAKIRLADALSSRNWSDEDIANFAWKNWARFWSAAT